MSRTFRKHGGFRNPRGRKQALQRGDRKVPPDENRPTSRQNQVYDIAWRLAEKGWKPDRVAQRLVTKARKTNQHLTHPEALKIAQRAAEHQKWSRERSRYKIDWDKRRQEDEKRDRQSSEILDHLQKRLPQLRNAYKATDATNLIAWARDKLEAIWEYRIYPAKNKHYDRYNRIVHGDYSPGPDAPETLRNYR
jgi:uncharacterized membrane-anchored protein YhcB (DUF1043 family)